MGNQHMQRTSLVVKEMQMKPQLDITISDANNIGKERSSKHSPTLLQEAILRSHFGKLHDGLY